MHFSIPDGKVEMENRKDISLGFGRKAHQLADFKLLACFHKLMYFEAEYMQKGSFVVFVTIPLRTVTSVRK